jgi:putative mRNA 3-end processing factor
MRSSRREKARAPRTAVAWRDGVHVTGTPIWCDARRAREVCFTSRYEAVPGARHGQLIATAATLALYGDGAAGAVLASPPGRPFTLGTVRLELTTSGAGLGAAMLGLDVGDVRVLYAGRVGAGDGLGGPRDVRRADVVVLGVERGELDAPFVARADALAWTREAWGRARRAGGALVVLYGAALDAIELCAGLVAEVGEHLVVPRGLRAAIDRARAAGVLALPTIRRAGGRIAGGDLVLWPIARAAAAARLALPARSARVALGPTADRLAARLAPDGALRWSAEVDAAGARAFAEETGARSLILTGAGAAELAPHLGARVLAPPTQMSLF